MRIHNPGTNVVKIGEHMLQGFCTMDLDFTMLDRKAIEWFEYHLRKGSLVIVPAVPEEPGEVRTSGYKIQPKIVRGRVEFPSAAEAIKEDLLEEPESLTERLSRKLDSLQNIIRREYDSGHDGMGSQED